jgi:predicted metal-binding membrane protein
MSDTVDRSLNHLPPAAAGLAALLARPKAVAAVCVLALAGLGWLYLGLLVAASGISDGTGYLPRAFAVICQAAPPTGGGLLLVASMWSAMVLAMMLPSAAPMIFTYAEIADTAARKRERIVSPMVLAGGYAAVWLGFAAVAALAQLALTRAAWLGGGVSSAGALFAGALFLLAGLYQFSALKNACLTQCQRPFPFFFAHWQTTARGVFRLGLQQGLYCLGCCWAMMLLMFATGAMNVLWMAALGMVMTAEKMLTGRRLTTAVGCALIAIGAISIIAAAAAHWPPPAN